MEKYDGSHSINKAGNGREVHGRSPRRPCEYLGQGGRWSTCRITLVTQQGVLCVYADSDPTVGLGDGLFHCDSQASYPCVFKSKYLLCCPVPRHNRAVNVPVRIHAFVSRLIWDILIIPLLINYYSPHAPHFQFILLGSNSRKLGQLYTGKFHKVPNQYQLNMSCLPLKRK